MDQDIIEKAKAYVQGLFAEDSGGHDMPHTLRVYENAMKIASSEDCDIKTVALAALLHDADDHKLFETEDLSNARTFLQANGISGDKEEEILKVISEVSFSKNRDSRPSSIEAMIVRDADRLDAMGAIGVARTFAYGGQHGRNMSESVYHFYEKLLLLKDMMCTGTGRELAEKRHVFLEEFLKELEEETGMGRGKI
ncbi:MAG: HD domain-containing protein [Clostridia bacterium]|nr:HD domain-containing protein [Clostridia bacterium]MBQ4454876.1 HD domain-containing protein [Clostridia bacterium]MBQ5957316.1 HD domain-containing protein [Clostridia bacterium]